MNFRVNPAGGEIAGIFFCPHRPDEGCDCRKPKPGLFGQIAAAFDVDLHGVPAIGDSLRDLEAAAAAAATPVLVRTGNGEETERQLERDCDVAVHDDLCAAARAIIASQGP